MTEEAAYIEDWSMLLRLVARRGENEARRWANERWHLLGHDPMLSHEPVSWYVVPEICQALAKVPFEQLTGAQQSGVAIALQNFLRRYHEHPDEADANTVREEILQILRY